MKATLSPYLNFMGQTKEAMEFYHSILGGDLNMQTYEQSGQAKNDEDKNLIMHAELKNDWLTFMAADGNAEHPVKMGDNISMSLSGEDESLKEIFDKLAEGGKVDFPMEKQFWGDTFGMLTDKFGVHWMVNLHNPENEPEKK